MGDSIKVCPALGVAQNVRTFVVVAWNFKEGLKTDAVHDGGFNVCTGESDEAREEAIELLLDVVADSFGFVIVENGILGVASAKEAAIGQFGEITLDWETANETVVWEFGTLLADVLLFFGNFIDEDKNDFPDFIPANGAFVGDGSSRDAP
jgi:hypothetical protein